MVAPSKPRATNTSRAPAGGAPRVPRARWACGASTRVPGSPAIPASRRAGAQCRTPATLGHRRDGVIERVSAVDEPVVEVHGRQRVALLVELPHVRPRLAVALAEHLVLRAQHVPGVEVLRVR